MNGAGYASDGLHFFAPMRHATTLPREMQLITGIWVCQ